MRILLLSMPDTADVLDYFIRLPNLAIVSLAGSLPRHEVKVFDLIACKPNVRDPLVKVLDSFKPHVVGLSAMTFQFGTMTKICRLIKTRNPSVKLVAGGYHPSLTARETPANGRSFLDFIVRGEGELTFRELMDEVERGRHHYERIKGLSFRENGRWSHNEDRPLQDLSGLPLPKRESRIIEKNRIFDLPADVAETSRGCPYACNFCSITQMYGRNFRRFPLKRIVEDLKTIKARGSKAVFLVDDNITYDIDHFRSVCRAIVNNNLNDIYYTTQVSAVGIARNPQLVAEMKKANFRGVFVGFEAMDPSALKKVNKPTNPEINRQAAKLLRSHDIGILAGCIVGYPDDDKLSVKRNFRLIKKLKPDTIYAQYLTPYPKTVVRKELLDEGLIENIDDYDKYDGFTCNIRTRYLSRKSLYRALKVQNLISNVDPRLIAVNYFLRHIPVTYITAIVRAAIDQILFILLGRQRSSDLDIE